MTQTIDTPNLDSEFTEQPINVSRRKFLLTSAGISAGALVIGIGLPVGKARAASPGSQLRVPAFLEILADNSVRLQSPFVEGGQGVFTAMAQIVGEELDADPATFKVVSAPPGADYLVMDNGMRITGGSLSVRSSYPTMRRLGALARQMLLEAGAVVLEAPIKELTTEPGKVVHTKSGRSVPYGKLAAAALDMPVPDANKVRLRDEKSFRWIGKGMQRIDVYDKSVGKAQFSIDTKVDGMLHAAVQHAPRLGMTVAKIRNLEAIKNMPGVDSVHTLDGAVAVLAERWWHAKIAVEAAQVDWAEAKKEGQGPRRHMPADFSSAGHAQLLESQTGAGDEAEAKGDARNILDADDNRLEATYHTQYVRHAQLEPSSALARFNQDGGLDIWLPNQAQDMFLADIAKRTGLKPEQINLHSPMLGGFFGRHFLYDSANPYPQAIELAKKSGRPVKLIWSREEEFLRDTVRPMAVVKLRASLDKKGLPKALEAISACEGPGEAIRGRGKEVDESAVEGLTGKSYGIKNVRIAQNYVKSPAMQGYWRSVGNSMNDFVYECFLDEVADQGKVDPYELRLQLLKGNKRLTNLLNGVVELAGGWQRGPYTADDGSKRARGIAMASPFGSEVASIAEVSINNSQVQVHHIWQAMDPGSVVNPAIIEAQINSAVALGLSQTLVEEVIYKNGELTARNYDNYPILRPAQMPEVHVAIIESGAKMGGIGEPGLPTVPPAVINAVSHLLGRRIRSMPLSKEDLTA